MSQDGAAPARALRTAQLIRAGVLVLVGLAVTFTAAMHRDVTFDVSLMFLSLGVIGFATLIEYWSIRQTPEAWWVAARASIAIAAAGAMLAVTDSVAMALVVSLWAVLTAVITLMRLVRGVQPQRVALPSLLLSLALAVVCLLVRVDPVAITGFFGAYAIVRGVFLAIAALDTREASNPADEAPATLEQPTQPGTHE